jgi:hypothetical protein
MISSRLKSSRHRGADHPFADSVHPGHLDAGEHHLDPRIGHHSVEQFGELPVPVPDQKPCPASGILKVYDQIPGGLGHPGCTRMRRRTQHPDPP